MKDSAMTIQQRYDKKDQFVKLVNFINNGGSVQRFHTFPLIKPDTVSSHSFGVAWWCALIYDQHPRVELLLEALGHDLAEHVTGDMPSNFKWRAPAIAEELDRVELGLRVENNVRTTQLKPEEEWALRLADRLDMLACMVRERMLGNHSAELVFARVVGNMNDLFDRFPRNDNKQDVLLVLDNGRALYHAILEIWQQEGFRVIPSDDYKFRSKDRRKA